MRFFLSFFLFLQTFVSAFEVDFDYVFIGSSPISLLEACYRSSLGSRVLIVEADEKIGGAWKTINICGVENVDMGCHQIGTSAKIKKFLEEILGCKLVSMNNPHSQGIPIKSSDVGFYFSKGCCELIDNLQDLLSACRVELALGHKIDKVYLDFDRLMAQFEIDGKCCSTTKIVVTPHSNFQIVDYKEVTRSYSSKYHHLYMLIQAETPAAFTYMNGFCEEMIRTINLTPFLTGLEEKGQQLIAIQTYKGDGSKDANFYLEEFKKNKLIDASSVLVTSENFVYEQSHLDWNAISSGEKDLTRFFEILKTEAFWNIADYVEKWEQAFHRLDLLSQ